MKKQLSTSPPRLQRMISRFYACLQTRHGIWIADPLSRANFDETAEEIEEEQMQAQMYLLTANFPISERRLGGIELRPITKKFIEKINQGWPPFKIKHPT